MFLSTYMLKLGRRWLFSHLLLSAGMMSQLGMAQQAKDKVVGGMAMTPPPHDIIDPQPVPVNLLLWLPLLAVALVAAYIVYLLYRKYHTKQQPTTMTERALTPTEHRQVIERRLQELNLQHKDWPQVEWFFQVSHLYREAIELRTGLNATDRTTIELKEVLPERWPLDTESCLRCLSFLQMADSVKFGGQRFERAAMEQAYGLVSTDVKLLLNQVDQNREISSGAAVAGGGIFHD